MNSGAGEISYLFWLFSVQQECASYTRINYGSPCELVPYCAAHTNIHGLAKEIFVCSRTRSGTSHNGRSYYLKTPLSIDPSDE